MRIGDTREKRTIRAVRLGWMVLLAACSRAPRPEAPTPVPAPQPAAPAAAPTLTLGVIVSQTNAGAAAQYSEALLEGIRLAADEATRAGAHRVQLMVRDDSANASKAAAALRDLEHAEVAAVIGPITTAPFNAAIRARTAPDLVMLAPSLTQPVALPNAYAMNREDSAGAVLLGKYAATLKRTVGVIVETGGERTADAAAFTRAYVAATGRQPASASFSTGTTTFASQIRKMRDAHVQVLYLPVSALAIPQIVPQLGYYGLQDVQLLGGEAWTADATARSTQKGLLEGAVASTILPRSSDAIGWEDFRAAYEQTYRRSLQSVLPALGYDAARLILGNAPHGNVKRSDIASAIAKAKDMRGATGVLHVGTGTIQRTPFLVQYRSGTWQRLNFTGAQ